MVQIQRQRDLPLASGDVVTLQDSSLLMTVEAVRAGRFGAEADCCWFDTEDCLQYRTFPTAQLNVFPRPAPERPVVAGTEVRLRSRGPVMTVRALRKRGGTVYAECVWCGPMQTERRRLFPQSVLVLTLLERFEDFRGKDL